MAKQTGKMKAGNDRGPRKMPGWWISLNQYVEWIVEMLLCMLLLLGAAVVLATGYLYCSENECSGSS